MIYFLSDLHFGHNNILDFEKNTRGKWKTSDDMTEGLIKLWNETITNDDIVYNLGDFFFNMKPGKVDEILDRLNYKEMILVAGNHDHLKLLKRYRAKGIRVVYADMLKRNGRRYYLSHYPTLIGRKNLYNLHGHIQSQDMETKYHINVGFDFTRKIALSFDEIEEIVEKREKDETL